MLRSIVVRSKHQSLLKNLRLPLAIFGKYSKTFVEPSEQFWNLCKLCSESGRKSSENHQKCRYRYVYIRKRILHAPLWIWILSSQVEHSKIKFMSTSKHVISSIYFVFWRYMLTMYCYWSYKRYLATELSLNVCI